MVYHQSYLPYLTLSDVAAVAYDLAVVVLEKAAVAVLTFSFRVPSFLGILVQPKNIIKNINY